MEPSSAEDGDQPLHTILLIAWELQWSRPQLRTETAFLWKKFTQTTRFNGAVLS